MNDLPTIEEIKSQLRAGIETANKATPGPWEVYNAGTFPGIEAPNKNVSVIIWGDKKDDGGVRAGHQKPGDANAAFIAQSRTLCPAACSALLIAIEVLEAAAHPLTKKRGIDTIRRKWAKLRIATGMKT